MLKSLISNRKKIVSVEKDCLLEIFEILDIYRRELSRTSDPWNIGL